MRTVNLEFLRPDEVLKSKEESSIVYLPIGPLEWHGPHLPLGMDPLNAQSIAQLVAQRAGGVVFPTFYWGTERERSPEMLKSIGFQGDEWIIGMDFPANSMPSYYIPEDPFGLAVRQYLNLLVKHGYKMIIIVNGHGAENHIHTLKRLANEFTAETDSTVLYTITTFLGKDGVQDMGHASQVETAIMMNIHPECVDLGALPPREIPLKNTQYAIVDDETFRGNPNGDFTCMHDPRDATAELGQSTMDNSVQVISEMVKDAYYQLNNSPLV